MMRVPFWCAWIALICVLTLSVVLIVSPGSVPSWIVAVFGVIGALFLLALSAGAMILMWIAWG